jgi:hypothetical protein
MSRVMRVSPAINRGDSMRHTTSIAARTSRCGLAGESVERVPEDMSSIHLNIFHMALQSVPRP